MFWLLLALIWLSAGPIWAQSSIANFVFITEPQTIAPGTSSDQITVEAQDSAGNPVKGSTVCLEFTSSSPTGDFSTNETWGESFKILVLTLGSNQYRRNFFYKDTSAGIHTLSLRAAPRAEGTTCPSMTEEEWNVQWTANHTIIVGENDNEVQQSTAPQSSPASSVTGSASSILFNYPSIKADAGEDREVVAGMLVEFKGRALSIKDEPLENARFWWNFGDGETAEGRATLHTFRIPGTYTAGLHVSSGEYAASDYITVSVVPNQLQVIGIISGEEGFIKIANKGKAEIDFGGWIVEDSSGKMFLVPVKTKIAGGAEIAFPNSVTSLFLSSGLSAVIRYPNGREALRWNDYRGSTSPASATKPVAAPADVNKHPVSNKKTDEEARAVSPELAAAGAIPDANSKIFFALAGGLSLLAAVGFLLLKNSKWLSKKF